ncbi:hypothetical protein [Bacillus sp. E(2018)]|uniref:hypothetical protein n=1 Tax=Bacillus sp. E(2018) TaxID=2502239 RepID=UPI0010F6BA79|nr:hypothetical protein [Bacillus sp. E(2018)]
MGKLLLDGGSFFVCVGFWVVDCGAGQWWMWDWTDYLGDWTDYVGDWIDYLGDWTDYVPNRTD